MESGAPLSGPSSPSDDVSDEAVAPFEARPPFAAFGEPPALALVAFAVFFGFSEVLVRATLFDRYSISSPRANALSSSGGQGALASAQIHCARGPALLWRSVVAEARDRTGGRRLRPWFLVAALLATLLVGMRGASAGCATVAYLRAGSMPDESSAIDEAGRDPARAFWVLDEVAHLRAIAEARRVTFPLGVAEGLLSVLVIVASAAVLVGRPGSARIARQVFVAYAAMAIASFALTYPMQAQYVESLRRTAQTVELPQWTSYVLPVAPYKGLIRLLAFQLLPVGLGLLAMRSGRSRAFLEQTREVEERPIDDEDEL